MAEQMTEYVCMACGGSMRFDAASGKMKCDYCDSTYSMEEVKAYYAEENKTNAAQDNSKAAETAWGEELSSMKAYRCQACGAELVCDDTTAATSCPYCGNVAIMPQQLSGMIRPKYVIPFKIEKEEAKNKLTAYCKGKKLLPGSFTGDHIDEIKGVYVPFWLYSGTVDADVKFNATQEEVKKTSTEKITTTKHYDVRRKGGVHFDKIPADASSSMPDDLMDSIEPYDYKDIKNFEMEYLAGYMADKYDVSDADSKKRARKRAEQSTVDMLKETVKGYNSVNERQNERRVHFLAETQEYAMLPVWLLSTNWNGKNFLFAINGQTGKMTGNLPIDKKKQWFFNLLIAIPLLVLGLYMGNFQSGGIFMGIAFAAIGALIVNGINTSSMRPVSEKRAAKNYVGTNKDGSQVKVSIKEDRFIHTTTKKEPINKN